VESTNIYRDAMSEPAFRRAYPKPAFVRVPEGDARPGCFVVAPDGWLARQLKLVWPGKEGHIALVERIERGASGDVARVSGIDCSGTRGVSRRDVTFMIRKGGCFVTLAQDVRE
jgi:hypothetical protein